MQKQDNHRFAQMLAVLSETYKPFSPAKEKIWAAVFKDYEIQDFEKAVMSHITDEDRGSFDPKPADILRFMPEKKQKLQLENKGSLSYCETTAQLLRDYGPGTAWWESKNA